MEQEKYDALMSEFDAVNQQIKELKAKKDALRTDLLIAIKIDEIDNVESDTHRLKFTISKRRSFNKDLAIDYLEQHGEDMSIYYQESEYETLKIKPKTQQVEADE